LSLDADVEDANGFSRTLHLGAVKNVSGAVATVHGMLDLDKLNADLASVQAETGVLSANDLIYLRLHVRSGVSSQAHGRTFSVEASPDFQFHLSSGLLRPDKRLPSQTPVAGSQSPAVAMVVLGSVRMAPRHLEIALALLALLTSAGAWFTRRREVVLGLMDEEGTEDNETDDELWLEAA
jgi:hypothetical protein